MAVTQEEARVYARSVLQQLEKEPEKLSEHERRLATKFQESDGRLRGIFQDIEAMRSQIQQAQARLRSLELQAENEQGKCNGFIEYLVELKFGGTPKVDTPAPEPKKAAGSKAETSPSRPDRKKSKAAKPNGKHATA